MESELQLATTRQLVDELVNRFETILIFGEPKADRQLEHALSVTQGNGFTLFGAATFMAGMIQSRLEDDRRPANDDEDLA